MTYKEVKDWATADVSPGVKVAAWRVLFSAILIGHIFVVHGCVPEMASGFARADDVQQHIQLLADTKVGKEELLELERKVSGLERKLEGTDTKVDALLELSYLQMIRYLQSQICDADGYVDRQNLQIALDEYERRFRSLTGRAPPGGASC